MAVEKKTSTSNKNDHENFSKLKICVWVGLLLLSAVGLAFVSPGTESILDKIILSLGSAHIGLFVIQ